ncbi:dihydrofolate reductase [Candidatus Peregrinibacteria bacterium]|nr:dihydrofolate reductase [Candidatus Peregrinibacteria bacterium]
MISLIAAVADNGVIGGANKLLWHLPDDLKRFKALTKGHPVIMGRKTYESIGRPLPERKNIVITHQDLTLRGCEVVSSLDEAIASAKSGRPEGIFIIGGGEIYKQAMEIADRMYLTHVHASPAGDVYFPEFDASEWNIIEEEDHPIDKDHAYRFTYKTYHRTRSPR